MKRLFHLFALILMLSTVTLEAFDKVIIWGHKFRIYPNYHYNTFSYIHEAFVRGFQHLGYNTYWFDDSDDVSNFDFSNSLFLTEGLVDGKIPLRNDSIYFLHNADQTKYQALSIKPIAIQVYTDDVLARNCIKIDTGIYYDIPARCLYMPWATDLLPDEIDEVKRNLPAIQKNKKAHWIGTIGGGIFGNEPQIDPFITACNENGIEFVKRNPWATGVSNEEHKQLISTSYMAPTIVGEWQQKVGYIPCRIFKNISYGQMGITNSLRVYEIMEKKIVYNPDTYQLFFDAKKRVDSLTLDEMFELMDLVKTKHTYLNRIQTMLDFLKILENQ